MKRPHEQNYRKRPDDSIYFRPFPESLYIFMIRSPLFHFSSMLFLPYLNCGHCTATTDGLEKVMTLHFVYFDMSVYQEHRVVRRMQRGEASGSDAKCVAWCTCILSAVLSLSRLAQFLLCECSGSTYLFVVLLSVGRCDTRQGKGRGRRTKKKLLGIISFIVTKRK